MSRFYIGIDMGTSSAKLLLLRNDGVVIRAVNSDYAVSQPQPGWREIEPEQWFSAMMKGFEALLSNEEASRISGIGVTGQMHTTVFLDDSGEPLRSAISWDDTRSKALLPELREKVLSFSQLQELTNLLSAGAPIASLYWLKQNEPENAAALSKFLIGPDYLVYRLTGNLQTDYCEASTSGLFDMSKRTWSEEVREILGVPSSVYPAIKGSMRMAGTVLSSIARRAGFPENVPVIVGTGDNVATAYSLSMMEKNISFLSLGTSGVLAQCRADLAPPPCGKQVLYSPDGSVFHSVNQAVLQSCGNSLNWWVQKILGQELSNVGKLSVEKQCDNHLLFYPHLTGDKSLYNDPELRGAFLGLYSAGSRDDMTYAVLEGTAFGLRQLFEKLGSRQTHLPVIGGGAQSDVWMQVLANVLHVTTVRLSEQAGAAYGIALMALKAIDCQSSSICADGAQACASFSPNPDQSRIHDEKYEQYLRIHQALKIVYP